MNGRTMLAGVLGALGMFVWMFIAHMVLPLGEAGMQEISNEAPATTAMEASLGARSGIYMFPGSGLGPDATTGQRNAAMKEYSQKLAASPSGLLIYRARGATFNFGKLLGVEFVTELIEAMLAAWLLSMTVLSGFVSRAGFVTVVGLIAAISTNISYWNWYNFPGNYTISYIFTQAVGFVCAGLVIAAMTRAKPAARAKAAA